MRIFGHWRNRLPCASSYLHSHAVLCAFVRGPCLQWAVWMVLGVTSNNVTVFCVYAFNSGPHTDATVARGGCAGGALAIARAFWAGHHHHSATVNAMWGGLCSETSPLVANDALTQVRTFDVSTPPAAQLDDADPRIVRIRGDIRRQDALLEACDGVDCIFHIASFGMSGKEMVDTQKTREVRVPT